LEFHKLIDGNSVLVQARAKEREITFRLEQQYFDLVTVLAREAEKTRSEYMREEVIIPYLAQKIRERTVSQFSSIVSQFIRHVKEYVDLATGVPIAGGSGLPSDKRRDELEALVWKAMQDAAEFMKTEEAAKNARARTHVMEVMAAMAACGIL
jgi:hypothetical protein